MICILVGTYTGMAYNCITTISLYNRAFFIGRCLLSGTGMHTIVQDTILSVAWSHMHTELVDYKIVAADHYGVCIGHFLSPPGQV